MLLGYSNMLEAFYAQSVQVTEEAGIGTNSTPHWNPAIKDAKDARQMALEAARLCAAGDPDKVDELGVRATEALPERYETAFNLINFILTNVRDSANSGPPNIGRAGYLRLYRAAKETALT